jgi:zinc protease
MAGLTSIAGETLEFESRVQSFITRGVRKRVLSNGLTVLTKEIHDKPIVATTVWYRVGSRNEELGQTGKSHFLEHMLFKGTDRYRKGEIDLITLSNGGANNAFTWLDFTAYYFTFASDRWEAALEIEANRMRNTSFDPVEFESEKKVVEEELRIGLDGPWEALENEVWASAFRQHPYHWPTVGWLEDLEAATASEMKGYYDKWYHPQNATLVIVGDIETNPVLERVEELFGAIPRGPEVKERRLIEPPQRGEKRIVVKKNTPVERLLIGYHTPQIGHPDAYALHVVETILSTGKRSRLYHRLIDTDQSVTMVKANYQDHIDPPLFYVQAEVKPGFALKDVEKAIHEEIDRLRSEGAPVGDLDRAKRLIEAEFVLSNEEALQQALALGQYETIAVGDHLPQEWRGHRYLDRALDMMRAVDSADVARVAERYLDSDNRTVGYLVNDDAGTSASPFEEGGAPAFRIAGRARFRTGFPSARPTPSQAGVRPTLDVERHELPNGMVVLLSANHSHPSVSISAIVSTGSRFEPDDKAGLASLTGALLDEGTRTKTSEEIAEAIESVGGRIVTFGDYQASGAHASLLAKDVALGIDLTCDILSNAVFPDEKVKQHIDRRIAQIKSRLDVPRVQASDVFNEIVFGRHPQHRPPIGYQETVSRVSRSDIVEFYERYYQPNNMILAVTGDIDKSEVRAQIEETFGVRARRSDLALPEVPPPAILGTPVERFVAANKEQVNIFIGHVGIERRRPDYHALLVLDTILGSSPGFTSRIPRILRDEQGLAYATFSNITATAGLDPGRFVAYIGTSPENLDKALTGLRGEILRIVEEPVSVEELVGAKAYLTGNFVFDFQTNGQITRFLIDAEVYGLGFDYMERYPELIRQVSVEDVARVARAHIHPERLVTVVVGPVDEQGRLTGTSAGSNS